MGKTLKSLQVAPEVVVSYVALMENLSREEVIEAAVVFACQSYVAQMLDEVVDDVAGKRAWPKSSQQQGRWA